MTPERAKELAAICALNAIAAVKAQVGDLFAVSRVVKVVAAPGQAVSPGQLLATLQSSEVGRARSEAIAAEARLELANKTLERKRRLGADRRCDGQSIQSDPIPVPALHMPGEDCFFADQIARYSESPAAAMSVTEYEVVQKFWTEMRKLIKGL